MSALSALPDTPVPMPRATAQVFKRFAALLVERDVLSRDRLEELEHRSTWIEEPLDRLVLKEGLVDDLGRVDLLAEASGLPVLHMAGAEISSAAVEAMPPRAVTRYQVMPVRMENGIVTLATDRLRDPEEEERLRVLLGHTLGWVLCTTREIAECIKHYYGVGIETYLNLKTAAEKKADADWTGQSANGAEDHPDIPAFVREIVADAIRADASDIHFEPGEESFTLRYRIDGVLYHTPMPQGVERFQRAIVSSIKIMAQLNIAERRIPQDGRFDFDRDGELFDLRVSVLPTRHGETVDLRILNRSATFLKLDDLGVGPQRARLDNLLTLPYGMILFTGPTGSGKTTSLYAALDKLNDSERKIITVEDPVEYQIRGITQMQVHSGIGFTFATGLRALLRHDPDVILIGEIRDEETAEIASSASLTGHLVFSTLHTNDSASAVTRLIDMGIEPYLVASSVQGIVAQRLVRCLCPYCQEETTLDSSFHEEVHLLYPQLSELPPVRRGRGCPFCRFTGYHGRRAIFEILEMNDELRAMVVRRASSTQLMTRAQELGMTTLRQSGWEYVLQGLTTVEDLMRVTRRTRLARAHPLLPL